MAARFLTEAGRARAEGGHPEVRLSLRSRHVASLGGQPGFISDLRPFQIRHYTSAIQGGPSGRIVGMVDSDL